MKNLKVILITTLIALPIGAFAKDVMLKHHENLQHARTSLNDAYEWIGKSQKANEHVWGDEGGHGQKAKEAIEKAKSELDLAAEWVNSHEK